MYSSQHVGTIVCFLVSVFVTLCRQIILDLPLPPQLQVIKFNQTFSAVTKKKLLNSLVNKTTNCKTGTTTSTNISLKIIEKTYRKGLRCKSWVWDRHTKVMMLNRFLICRPFNKRRCLVLLPA